MLREGDLVSVVAMDFIDSDGKRGKIHLSPLRLVEAPVGARWDDFLYPEFRSICGAVMWGDTGERPVTCKRCLKIQEKRNGH